MLADAPVPLRPRFVAVLLVLFTVVPLALANQASAEPPPRLRAPRLSISVAAPNVVMFGVAAGVLFASAEDDSKQDRKITLGVASACMALFGMNLGWIVQAGSELNARLDKIDDRMSPKTARIGTAFSTIDSAARASLLSTGIALIVNPGEGIGAAGAVGAGIAIVVLNGLMLPFHIWALVVHIKELKWRKHGVDPYRANRLSPISGGIRF